MTVPVIAPGKTKIGWIGTGVMGSSMAGHLLAAGYAVSVYSRTKPKAETLLSKGAAWAESPKVLAQQSDVIFAIVGFPSDVREVMLGANGALAGSKAGNVLVDMTTSEPSLAVEIAEAAKAKGVFSIDAPVSGGDIGAKNAALSIMVGGDKEVVDALQPCFSVMGKTIIHQGSPGAGQHTKMVNQILIASNMVGVCEALLYGYKAGLDLETVMKSVSVGAAGSWSLSNLGPRIMANNFDPGFFVEHFIKDMGIALDEAKRMDLSLPGLALSNQLYLSLKAQGGGRLGTHALELALSRLSGIDWKALQSENIMATKGEKFAGLTVAMVTPFRNGLLDEPALRKLVDWHVEQGTDTICPVGTTGESPTLSHDEHHRVIDVVCEQARGRIKVVAGTGSNSTAEAIELTVAAKKSGADGALVVGPYYNKPTMEGFYQHFKAINDACDLPIILYNIPGRTAKNIEPETIARIGELPHVVAVKESTGSMDAASQIIALSNLTVLSGDDSLTLPLLSLGGRGVVSVVGNIVPKDVKAMLAAWDKGDIASAQGWHRKLFPLCRDMLGLSTNPIPVKAAMQMLGRDTGEVRLPLTPLDAKQCESLAATLKKYGLL